MSTQNFNASLFANSALTAFQPAEPIVQIRDLIYKVAGMYHADNRLRFLEERCQRRLKARNVLSLSEYYEVLSIGSDRNKELTQLLNEVTIGETSFHRNQPQFEAFQKTVLPVAVKNKERLPLKHIRIWSAGCSTGEEPYTLAMICREEQQCGILRGHTFEILATDLNERSLEHARAAVYSEYALRNAPAEWKHRYMVKVDQGWRVNDEIRNLVRLSRVNLVDDSRMLFMKAMDAIFCCNVLIYFDAKSKRRVIQHFFSNLLPNSFLFLGHSESLFNITNDFTLVHLPGATAYHKATHRPGAL